MKHIVHLKNVHSGDPTWLSDRLAFVWFRPRKKQQSIYIINRDGSYFSRINSLIANAPAWGPSGDELIYTEGVVGSDSQIFKTNLKNPQRTQLTDDGSNHSGNWFDPKQLSLSRGTTCNYVVGKMKTETEH